MMTRQQLEENGHKVKGTYRGPFTWPICQAIYNDLQQAKAPNGDHIFPLGVLRIVQQEGGYNIVEIL
jgi:hypothetical protein